MTLCHYLKKNKYFLQLLSKFLKSELTEDSVRLWGDCAATDLWVWASVSGCQTQQNSNIEMSRNESTFKIMFGLDWVLDREGPLPMNLSYACMLCMWKHCLHIQGESQYNEVEGKSNLLAISFLALTMNTLQCS